jgi:hypothetical protein
LTAPLPRSTAFPATSATALFTRSAAESLLSVDADEAVLCPPLVPAAPPVLPPPEPPLLLRRRVLVERDDPPVLFRAAVDPDRDDEDPDRLLAADPPRFAEALRLAVALPVDALLRFAELRFVALPPLDALERRAVDDLAVDDRLADDFLAVDDRFAVDEDFAVLRLAPLRFAVVPLPLRARDEDVDFRALDPELLFFAVERRPPDALFAPARPDDERLLPLLLVLLDDERLRALVPLARVPPVLLFERPVERVPLLLLLALLLRDDFVAMCGLLRGGCAANVASSAHRPQFFSRSRARISDVRCARGVTRSRAARRRPPLRRPIRRRGATAREATRAAVRGRSSHVRWPAAGCAR